MYKASPRKKRTSNYYTNRCGKFSASLYSVLLSPSNSYIPQPYSHFFSSFCLLFFISTRLFFVLLVYSSLWSSVISAHMFFILLVCYSFCSSVLHSAHLFFLLLICSSFCSSVLPARLFFLLLFFFLLHYKPC